MAIHTYPLAIRLATNTFLLFLPIRILNMTEKPQHPPPSNEDPVVISIDDLEEFESPPPVILDGEDDDMDDDLNDID